MYFFCLLNYVFKLFNEKKIEKENRKAIYFRTFLPMQGQNRFA